MAPVLEEAREGIEGLCRRYGVRRLEAFGSAVRGDFEGGRSDVDFFYEFEGEHPMSLADRYFGLWEGLEALLGVKVDLVSAADARNPYFLEVANRHRVTLYAA